jgi:hypothetical protein
MVTGKYLSFGDLSRGLLYKVVSCVEKVFHCVELSRTVVPLVLFSFSMHLNMTYISDPKGPESTLLKH